MIHHLRSQLQLRQRVSTFYSRTKLCRSCFSFRMSLCISCVLRSKASIFCSNLASLSPTPDGGG